MNARTRCLVLVILVVSYMVVIPAMIHGIQSYNNNTLIYFGKIIELVPYYFMNWLYQSYIFLKFALLPIFVIILISLVSKKYRSLKIFILMSLITTAIIPNVIYTNCYYSLFNVSIHDASDDASDDDSFYTRLIYINLIITILVLICLYIRNYIKEMKNIEIALRENILLWVIIVICINMLFPIGIFPAFQ